MSILQPARREGGKFLNPVPTTVTIPGTFITMMKRLLFGKEERVPKQIPGPFRTDTSIYAVAPASGLRITWMGHSTVLIEIDGLRILTDPVWSNHASPIPAFFAKRFYPPTLPLDQLPPLDAVLLSHDHYDHLDAPTIRALAKTSVPFICSLAMGRHLTRWGVAAGRITELDWTQSTSLGSLTITAVPARHFSGRRGNEYKTLWSSFAIKGPRHAVFFGADSGPFTEGLKEIGDVYGPFDLTMLEIGAYAEHWPEIHMGPAHAADGHLALRGTLMMPIHWGLLNLAYHNWREPVEWITREAETKGIKLFLPRPGEPTEVTTTEYSSRWWVG